MQKLLKTAPRSIQVEVKCYSLDGLGYCSELREFNFNADLDFSVSIGQSLTVNASPELGFRETASNFKCYCANFLGKSIGLKQRPLEVKYIEDSLIEDKTVILYLCKEELNGMEPVMNSREHLVSVDKPSEVAMAFIRNSVSENDPGYYTDTQRKSSDGASVPSTPNSSITERAQELEEEASPPQSSMSQPNSPHQNRDKVYRQLTVVPHLPTSHQAVPNPAFHHQAAPLRKADTLPNISSPASSFSEDDNVFINTLPHSSRGRSLAVPKDKRHSKSPTLFRIRRQRDTRSLSNAPSTNKPTISSPVQYPVQTRENLPLARRDAIRRRSVLDILPDSQPEYNLSANPLHMRFHFTDLKLDHQESSGSPSLQQSVELYINISNYMTVGQLKTCIAVQLKEQTSIVLPPTTPLTLYYTSVTGDTFELFNSSQFLCHTIFHHELASQQVIVPMMECRISSQLPEKELRVLYRINQLTGVRLEDDITAIDRDISSMTVLPECDQQEVQLARRSLHSYMMEVVKERDVVEYSSPRDISSREASMQLCTMTPSDNMIPITFHYETTFSLLRNLSIHTYADTTLASLFPALVVCGLVQDRIEDYTLQVTGEENYIYGEIELIAFRHIRKCIVKSEPIHLSVTKKKPIETERPHHFSIMPVDPFSSEPMDHSDLSRLNPIYRDGVGSSWEVDQKLRLMRVDVENVPQVSSKGTRQLRFSLKLLHGGKPLLPSSPPLMVSGKVDHDIECLSWSDRPLEFDVKIKDIPKAARILVTLEERKSRHSSYGEKNQLFYWGMISVFNCNGRLRSGEAELRLWKGEENRKTGDTVVPLNLATHPSNNPQPTAVRVTLVFEPVQPTPIVYPSTRESSCTSFTTQHPAVPNTSSRRQFRNLLSIVQNNRLYQSCFGKAHEAQANLSAIVITVYHLDTFMPRRTESETNVPDYVLGSSSNLADVLEMCYTLTKLRENIADIPDYIALKLLDSDFPEEHVRAFAVSALETLSDEQLEDYLLQLVQALKFDANHDSHLARFLLKKALTNKTIGHFFFWYLKSEMHSRPHMARFAVILETYLKGCGEALLTRFTDQVEIQNSLCDMASTLKRECDNGTDLESMQSLLPSYLENIKIQKCHIIPVHNPRQVLGKLNPKKCKVMSSKKRPMWLEMYNIHSSALRQSPVRLILKLGDDLRQDMITLRMFSLFEKLWEEQGLDLELIPYGCMATGPQTGFIEVVKNAKTIKEVSSVTNSTRLLEWIKSHQTNEFGEIDKEMVDAAIRRFTRSCAGYSVATYVLGIGDRHNDNIMVTTSGNLFHIDFGHFLGHIKYFMGFKREWAPFVLTPDFVHVMGGENSDMFETYKNLCCKAFLTLRRNADLIINLFSLMRSTGIPELTCVEDTDYIKNVLELETASSEHEADMRFRKVIQKCLNLKWTVQVMWRLHIVRNGSE